MISGARNRPILLISGKLLNSKSEMTRGGKIPRMVIMVGDKEVHNVCSERKQVEAHTHIESSPEIVPECVGRKSKMSIPGGKRQTQPLISEIVKKMRMSTNPEKRKQPTWRSYCHFRQGLG